ncbi:MAG: ATP-dependent endonuclease [Bacteroidetes bacterium 4572_112]|nr:MAG: ATP-dependent endonuclease [Bacteroidetes bacterium 4572_112]
MSNYTSDSYISLKREFGFEPTSKQDMLMQQLSYFVDNDYQRGLFVIKGYAGTGKTSIVSALSRHLRKSFRGFRLMAPTGRAAKVLGKYSGFRAATVHQSIYFAVTGAGGGLLLTLKENKAKNTIFIIDEASMIPDETSTSKGGGRNLLYDIMEYVYNDKGCKLIFIGDTAQLPPVGIPMSPALDPQYLKNAFSLDILTIELDEVVRQDEQSGILSNATLLRQSINNENYLPPFFDIYGQKDVVNLPGIELIDELQSAYDFQGFDNTVIITRSNKRANQYNEAIRNRILFREEKINAGDYLMVVKNNYFWLDDDSKSGFLANGDIMELMSVLKMEEMYGFLFANVVVRLVDYPDEREIEIKLLLNSLDTESPALSYEDNNRLYKTVLEDFMDIPSISKRREMVRQSEYFNAVQVKFAYALTCHKTQGGQWHTVFVDQGYMTEERMDKEYLRWLYTATTRATDRLFFINFPEAYFIEA